MSLINKVLQDLDRRQALAGAGDATVVQLRPAPGPKGDRRHGLWLLVAILLVAMLGGVGWMTMRLKFKPLTTPVPLQPAVPAQPAAAPTIAPTPPPSAVQAPAPAAAAAAVEPSQPAVPAPQASVAQAPVAPAPAAVAPVPASPAPPVADTLKLALAIESPPLETARPAEPKVERPKAEPRTAKLTKEPAPRALVDKRDRMPSDSSAASNEFRRALMLVNQGRVAEAEPMLAAILKAQPEHANARQVYVSLLLEQSRIEQARRALQDGLALAPSNAGFALALARIHASQRDYDAALAVMDKADPAEASGSSFQTLRAAVLQRLGRHAEAVEAYQNALRAAPQQAASWLGLAISYEALGRGNDARDAYRHSVDVGPLAPAAREYAEARLRALQ